jgi:hypothetical protein
MLELSSTHDASSRPFLKDLPIGSSKEKIQGKNSGNERGGKRSDPRATMDAVRGPDGFVLTIVSSQACNLGRDNARRKRGIACARTCAACDASPSRCHDGSRRVRTASHSGNDAPASIDGQLGAVATLRAPSPHLRGDRDVVTAAVFGMRDWIC